MTTIILTYYKERVKYLRAIIEALRKSKTVTDIIVFNQGEAIEKIDGVTVINSGRNFGCSVRHALALCIDDDLFFFQDDDLLVAPTTIATLLKFWNGKNVVGTDGCILTDGRYTSAIPVQNPKQVSYVDIVTGRVHLCAKNSIVRAFKMRGKLGLKIFRDDDILLSLANKGNMVIDCGITNLNEEGVGLSHEPQHYIERDLTCRRINEKLNLPE